MAHNGRGAAVRSGNTLSNSMKLEKMRKDKKVTQLKLAEKAFLFL